MLSKFYSLCESFINIKVTKLNFAKSKKHGTFVSSKQANKDCSKFYSLCEIRKAKYPFSKQKGRL
jgi:hypothetical protein